MRIKHMYNRAFGFGPTQRDVLALVEREHQFVGKPEAGEAFSTGDCEHGECPCQVC